MGQSQSGQQSQTTEAILDQTQQNVFDPQVQAAIQQGGQQLSGLLQSRLNAPLMQQQFTGFSPELNPLVQSAMNQQVAGLKAQQGRANQGIANALGGRTSSPALIQAINAQNQLRTQGGINKATGGALQAQQQLDTGLAGIIQNQNRGNLAARGQLFQETIPALNLFEQIRGFGQQTGKQTTQRKGVESQDQTSMTRQKGGLLGLL